jgi:hypothetical protein
MQSSGDSNHSVLVQEYIHYRVVCIPTPVLFPLPLCYVNRFQWNQDVDTGFPGRTIDRKCRRRRRGFSGAELTPVTVKRAIPSGPVVLSSGSITETA